MAHNLADEMLQSILAPPLRVPDAMFQDVGLVSPFSKVEQSASDVLLVCKRWMRVATPTLYHTVVIRSNAQAAALNAALTRNPDFGRHVRRFRLERPYPEYLNKTVTNTMPNIVDLCLPIGVLAADRPSDVYELLSISQPQHLLLVNYRPNHSNATFNKLVSKICAAIQSWTGLTGVTCNWDTLQEIQAKRSSIFEEITTLQHLSVLRDGIWPAPAMFPLARTLLARRTFKFLTLSCTSRHTYYFEEAKLQWREEPFTSRRVRMAWPDGFVDISSPTATEASALAMSATDNPFWKPLESASREDRIAIWHRIISFAIPRTVPVYNRWHWNRNDVWFTSSALTDDVPKKTLLVSRELYEATIRALVVDLYLATPVSLGIFCNHLRRDTFIANLPLTLNLRGQTAATDDHASYTTLFGSLRSLVKLYISTSAMKPSMDWMSKVGPSVGHTLRKLAFDQDRGPGSVTLVDPIMFFRDMTALEELSFLSDAIRFGIVSEAWPAGADGLKRLRAIECTTFHQSVLDALASIPLPGLECVHLKLGAKKARKFIERHGSSIKSFTAPSGITQQDLDALSNLEELKLTEENMPNFFSTLKSPSVKKILLTWPVRSGNWLNRYASTFAMLPSLAATRFPNLKEVWVDGAKDGLWPIDERSEKKNFWVPFVGGLAGAGVVLKDENGRAWRQRRTLDA